MLDGQLNLVTLYLGLSAGWDLQTVEKDFIRSSAYHWVSSNT